MVRNVTSVNERQHLLAMYPYNFEDIHDGYSSSVKLSPGGWVMLSTYKDDAEKLYNLEMRPDDVWLVGHPKTGTTWACELVWTVFHGADIEGAKTIPQMERWCSPEYDFLTVKRDVAEKVQEYKDAGKPVPDDLLKESTKNYMKICEDHPSPRLITGQTCLELLPPNLLDTCKVIYVARNPLDTCVSFCHFLNSLYETKEPIEFQPFFQMFISDLVPFGPFWKHIRFAWEKRNHPNMLFLFFEEMKADLPGVIKKVADFLDKCLSEDEVQRLIHYLGADEMKKNPMVNYDILKDMGLFDKDKNFVRKGIVGDYKNSMTPEMIQQMQQWWKKNMEGCDIKFPGIDII